MTKLTDLQAAGIPVIVAESSEIDGRWTFGATTDAQKDIIRSILFPEIVAIETKQKQSRITAKAIPNWATWTQADWDAYFTANLSPAQVSTVTTIALARTMLNRQNLVIQNLVKLVIAMRDNQWPDL